MVADEIKSHGGIGWQTVKDTGEALVKGAAIGYFAVIGAGVADSYLGTSFLVGLVSGLGLALMVLGIIAGLVYLFEPKCKD